MAAKTPARTPRKSVSEDAAARTQEALREGLGLAGHVPGQLSMDGDGHPQEPPAGPGGPRGATATPGRRRAIKATPASTTATNGGTNAGTTAATTKVTDAPPTPPGLSPEGVRDALRRSPHRPEDGNAKLTTDLPADLRSELTAYRTWHGFSERALLTLLVRQLLAGDPDGGWRQ